MSLKCSCWLCCFLQIALVCQPLPSPSASLSSTSCSRSPRAARRRLKTWWPKPYKSSPNTLSSGLRQTVISSSMRYSQYNSPQSWLKRNHSQEPWSVSADVSYAQSFLFLVTECSLELMRIDGAVNSDHISQLYAYALCCLLSERSRASASCQHAAPPDKSHFHSHPKTPGKHEITQSSFQSKSNSAVRKRHFHCLHVHT